MKSYTYELNERSNESDFGFTLLWQDSYTLDGIVTTIPRINIGHLVSSFQRWCQKLCYVSTVCNFYIYFKGTIRQLPFRTEWTLRFFIQLIITWKRSIVSSPRSYHHVLHIKSDWHLNNTQHSYIYQIYLTNKYILEFIIFNS